MPNGDAFVASFFPAGTSKGDVRLKVLTAVEAAALEHALIADALDTYYSAWVSFVDALRGIQFDCCTWATVKLYYSTFYSLRSALALARICAFHVGSSSFSVKAIAGHSPMSCLEKGTHKTVLKTFQREHPGHALLSQQIDLMDALDWLVDKREAVNYRQARFEEPDALPEFEFARFSGLRRMLTAYLNEPGSLFVFDPQHAILAYPLRALQFVGEQLHASSLHPSISKEEQTFLRFHAVDKLGVITALTTEMRRLRVLD